MICNDWFKKFISVSMAMLILGCFGILFPISEIGLVTANAEEKYVFLSPAMSIASAEEISLDQMYASSLTGEEKVYFKFKMPAQKGYVDFYSANINIETHSWAEQLMVQMRITDRLGDVFAVNGVSEGGEKIQNIRLEPDSEYYIEVYNNCGSNPGNFKFKLSYKEDLGGDSIDTADMINLDTEINGSLDGTSDYDYYKFTTGDTGNYTVFVKNINIDTHTWVNERMFFLQVRSQLDEILLDIRAEKNKDNSQTVELQPNTTYYIVINEPWSSGTGNYRFKVSPVRNAGSQPGNDANKTTNDTTNTDSSANTTEKTKEVTKVSVSLSKTNIFIGDTCTATATILPTSATNQNITWSSKDPKVATVDMESGVPVIKGIGEGTTEIWATALNGVHGSATVTVYKLQDTTSSSEVEESQQNTHSTSEDTSTSGTIRILADKQVIDVGESIYLKLAVYPENSTSVLKWKSSNSSVAAVSGYQIGATVIGLKEGIATIYAEMDNGNIASITITVHKSSDSTADSNALKKPGKVHGVKLKKAGKNKIKLSFKKVKGAKEYQLFVTIDGAQRQYFTVKKTKCTLTNFSGKKVTVKIRAKNNAGFGTWSAKKILKCC